MKRMIILVGFALVVGFVNGRGWQQHLQQHRDLLEKVILKQRDDALAQSEQFAQVTAEAQGLAQGYGDAAQKALAQRDAAMAQAQAAVEQTKDCVEIAKKWRKTSDDWMEKYYLVASKFRKIQTSLTPNLVPSYAVTGGTNMWTEEWRPKLFESGNRDLTTENTEHTEK
jgi:hypothetical protein